jgi:hypothetical protein
LQSPLLHSVEDDKQLKDANLSSRWVNALPDNGNEAISFRNVFAQVSYP